MAQMQHSDVVGDALLDIVWPPTSPLHACRRDLLLMLRSPDSASCPLAALWHNYSAFATQLRHDARRTVVNMAVQVAWRLDCYNQFPLKFARLCHPSVSGENRRQLVSELYSMPECCMDKGFTKKLRDRYDGSQGFLADRDLQGSLRLWAASTKTTNMHIERMLAQLKKDIAGIDSGSNKGHAPNAERLVGIGHLGQLLRAHIQAGGDDPRFSSRQRLLEDGVPITAAPAPLATSRPPGGFLLYRARLLQREVRAMDGKRKRRHNIEIDKFRNRKDQT